MTQVRGWLVLAGPLELRATWEWLDSWPSKGAHPELLEAAQAVQLKWEHVKVCSALRDLPSEVSAGAWAPAAAHNQQEGIPGAAGPR